MNYFGWVASDDSARRHILTDHASRTNDAPLSDCHALEDKTIHANEHLIVDLNGGRGTGVEVAGPLLRRQGMEVCVYQGRVRADLNPVPKFDALVGDEGRARKSAVIADPNDRSGLARRKHDGVVRHKWVGPRPRPNTEPISKDNLTGPMALNDGHPQDSPPLPPRDPVVRKGAPDVGIRQKTPHLVGDAPRFLKNLV